MDFIEGYDDACRVVGLRHVEWTEAGERRDYAQGLVESPAERRDRVQSFAAWLASQLHPTPVRQPRRRHA